MNEGNNLVDAREGDDSVSSKEELNYNHNLDHSVRHYDDEVSPYGDYLSGKSTIGDKIIIGFIALSIIAFILTSTSI